MMRNGLRITIILIALVAASPEARCQELTPQRYPHPNAPAPEATPRVASPGEVRLRVVFTGDIMGHDTQIASALATGEQGYD
jgi:hypothetical protein